MKTMNLRISAFAAVLLLIMLSGQVSAFCSHEDEHCNSLAMAPVLSWDCGPEHDPGAVRASLNLLNGEFKVSLRGDVATGEMRDYTSELEVPWYDYRDNIYKVDFHQGVIYVGSMAFANCANLASVTTFNGNIKYISQFAFSNCTNLTSIHMPNSVESIGAGAFFNCSSLTSIRIPSRVENIGADAFSNCTKLISVLSYNKTPPVLSGNQVFQNLPQSACLYVNDVYDDYDETIVAYRIAAGWNYFKCIESVYDYVSVHPHASAPSASRAIPTVSVVGKTLRISGVKQGGDGLQVRIIDMRGKTVFSRNVYDNGRMPLSNIPTGRYIVDIRRSGVRVGQSAVVVR